MYSGFGHVLEDSSIKGTSRDCCIWDQGTGLQTNRTNEQTKFLGLSEPSFVTNTETPVDRMDASETDQLKVPKCLHALTLPNVVQDGLSACGDVRLFIRSTKVPNRGLRSAVAKIRMDVTYRL